MDAQDAHRMMYLTTHDAVTPASITQSHNIAMKHLKGARSRARQNVTQPDHGVRSPDRHNAVPVNRITRSRDGVIGHAGRGQWGTG